MNFSEKLKKHRKALNMSQEELANQLDVSRQAVSKWENGQGFPETEKLLQLSNLFGVSLDYLLKEDPNLSAEENETGYYASRENVEGYLTQKAVGARKTAFAVAIIIFSSGFSILLPDALGTSFFLIGVAVGVGILILNSFAENRYKEIETQPLVFDSSFYREFKEICDAKRKIHGFRIAFGVVIIILAVICFLILEELLLIQDDMISAIIPIVVSFSVYLFIISGSALDAQKIILYNERHMEKLENQKKLGWLYGIVMPLAAMIFLAIGFKNGAWHPAWLIFPTAAFICRFIIVLFDKKNR